MQLPLALSTQPEAQLAQNSVGEVFTQRWVVEWILDLAGYTADTRLHELVIVEPSCGSGAFLIPMVERLLESCAADSISIAALGAAVWACDTHLPSVEKARKQVRALLVRHGLSRSRSKQLALQWIHHADYLLGSDVPKADIVVGNPPYVRHDDIPAHLVGQYRSSWTTMKGRCDLYVPFFQCSLETLKEEGKLVFICADRWMRNQYGTELRKLLHRHFSVDAMIRLHGVDAFESDVDAYPAITIMRNGSQKNGVIAECHSFFGEKHVKKTSRAIRSRRVKTKPEAASVAHFDDWFGPEAWPEGSAKEISAISRWEQSLEPLQDHLGRTRVGIGVASGSDKVFVAKDKAPKIEKQRLLPLIMSKHISTGKLKWSPTWLVNPWNGDTAIDLLAWPKTARYLESHRQTLVTRHVAKKNPNKWFRTIDKVNPRLLGRPKILFADMKSRMTPVVDNGLYYPHHNLYWITSEVWEMEVLAGLLLSDQAELFVRAYCVKMRGGTLRMQAQYLRKIRVPSPEALSKTDVAGFRLAYADLDRERATMLAEKFYVWHSKL